MRFLKYNWLPQDINSICLQQTVTGAASATLNGVLVDQYTNIAGISNTGSIRNISISSPNNISAVNFTITGMQNGVPITELLAGPSNVNNPTQGGQYYDSITSITVNKAATFSIGLGKKGSFVLIKINSDISPAYGGPFWALSVAGNGGDGNSADFQIYQTLDEVQYNNRTFLQMRTSLVEFFNIPVVADSNVLLQSTQYIVGDQYTNQLLCTNEILVSATVTGSATLIFRET